MKIFILLMLTSGLGSLIIFLISKNVEAKTSWERWAYGLAVPVVFSAGFAALVSFAERIFD